MRTLLQRRPSASLVMSLVALVMASSGTAVAASQLIKGDSLIRKGSLSGNRLRKHTITGRQINFRRLGTVPNARHAGYAASAGTAGYAVNATNATDATNATNATNASNAANLGGQPAGSYLTTASRVGTGGVVSEAGNPTGNTMTLFTHGPFTITMTCTTTSSGSASYTGMTIDATSSESNSVIDATAGVPANASINLAGTFNTDGTPRRSQTAQIGGGAAYTLEAPSGAGLVFAGSYGTDSNGVNNGCWANLAGIS